MRDEVFQQTIGEIVMALKTAGYSPYDQLTGYLQTGDVRYITRTNGARQKVMGLDKAMIAEYLKEFYKSSDVRSLWLNASIAVSA